MDVLELVSLFGRHVVLISCWEVFRRWDDVVVAGRLGCGCGVREEEGDRHQEGSLCGSEW